MAYLRVSTLHGQTTETQLAAIQRAGYSPTRTFEDVGVSGRKTTRPGLDACLEWLRDGDCLVVTELSRLGRNALAAAELVTNLSERGITVVSLREQLRTDSAMGRFGVQLFAALAQLEVEQTQERILLGLERARENGQRLGRPPALDADQVRSAQDLRAQGCSFSTIARELGLSRSTVHRYLTS
ncbi:recombinase family protein [Luteococcus sp. H138]|uniref:recombinase family protein n=1 Tax=Luteococcus sp. H138 TaxID=3139404 RepID=UPI00313D43F2